LNKIRCTTKSFVEPESIDKISIPTPTSLFAYFSTRYFANDELKPGKLSSSLVFPSVYVC